MIQAIEGVSWSVVDAVWVAMQGRLKEKFPGADAGHVMAFLMKCPVCWGIWREFECLGAIYGRPESLHIAVRPSAHGKWFVKGAATQFLRRYFAQYSVMIVREWTPEGRRLADFLGFQLENSTLVLRGPYVEA